MGGAGSTRRRRDGRRGDRIRWLVPVASGGLAAVLVGLTGAAVW